MSRKHASSRDLGTRIRGLPAPSNYTPTASNSDPFGSGDIAGHLKGIDGALVGGGGGSAYIKWVGDGQTIQGVIDSIVDAGADKPYVVNVPPGHEGDSYTEKAFVTVVHANNRQIEGTIYANKYITGGIGTFADPWLLDEAALIAAVGKIGPDPYPYGKEIRFPAGRYIINTPLDFHDSDAVAMVGAHAAATMIGTSADFVGEYMIRTGGDHFQRIVNLQVAGDNTIEGIRIEYTSDIVIDHVFIRGFAIGLRILGTWDTAIRDCPIESNTIGIQIHGSKKTTISGCIFSNGTTGVRYLGTSPAHGRSSFCYNNYFKNCNYGIKLDIGGEQLNLFANSFTEMAANSTIFHITSSGSHHVKHINIHSNQIIIPTGYPNVDKAVSLILIGGEIDYVNIYNNDFVLADNFLWQTSDAVNPHGRIHGNTGEDETITTATPTLHRFGVSKLDSTNNGIAATLPDGQYLGQRKQIIMTNAAHSSTVTVTHLATGDGGDGEVATFNAVDAVWILEWTGTEWVSIKASCTFV